MPNTLFAGYGRPERSLDAYAFETLTVSTTALGFTASNYDPTDRETHGGRAQAVMVTANDQDIRYTLNGTTPTTTVGHRLAAGDTVVVYGYPNIVQFRAIREDGTDSNVACTFFR